MSNPVLRAIESRTSTHHFDPKRPLPDQTIIDLVTLAIQAPSAYHFQNWRFIAARTRQAKERLRRVAHGQQKVADAAVCFIICGTLAAHTQLATRLQPSVQTGILPQPVADAWVTQANATYAGDLTRQRDEAIRSATLAAMTLMLAAQGMGLASCPMAGFDAQGLAQEFDLTPDLVPAILVAVGHPAKGNGPKKPRRPVSEILEEI